MSWITAGETVLVMMISDSTFTNTGYFVSTGCQEEDEKLIRDSDESDQFDVFVQKVHLIQNGSNGPEVVKTAFYDNGIFDFDACE